jgi:hypothetical protein
MPMRRIDELHLDYPFAGSRVLRDLLSHQGLVVGRRHVRTLMDGSASKLSFDRRIRPSLHRDTRSILTSRSRGPIKSGLWTSVRHDGKEETMS